jgi:AraC family transcriptional regulator, regulatory protein of adaptative response / methylated-DNA-[protein]-cysteine methyltransferase
MTTQEEYNYRRIAEAIEYIREHFRMQPNLDEVARHIHLSPYHFQRLFTDWAGVSPKKFLQYISVEHAKQVLKDGQFTLFDAAEQTGLSGTGRLHDLFLSIEGMTPGEFKNGGKNLSVDYEFLHTPFGRALAAATEKGVCFMTFDDNEENVLDELFRHFPNAKFRRQFSPYISAIHQIFEPNTSGMTHLKLHLRGTPFQLKVWEALLKIPDGNLTTYGGLAAQVEQPQASRAVGTAVGKNPVAFLIPCHRVIRSNGLPGGYRWGTTRKTAMIGWEAAKYKTSRNAQPDLLEDTLESENNLKNK